MADDEFPKVTEKPRKRSILGRTADQNKKQRLSGHKSGEDCKCARLKCFENVTEDHRKAILGTFNAFDSKEKQDSYLASMIKVHTVKRRRPRNEEEAAKFHEHSYMYQLIVPDNGDVEYIEVCVKAFCAIFGIGVYRVRKIRMSIVDTGVPPKDMQGKHLNRPHAHSPEVIDSIVEHIQSFKGRKAHYSSETQKLYLPEDLNIQKMYNMYCEGHPNNKVSYESYRKIFNGKFNISFGYPRSDTCSTCDELESKKVHYDSLLQTPTVDRDDIMRKKAEAIIDKSVHVKRADVFYSRKRGARQQARVSDSMEAIAFDYQKNLPCPNITTNDVYYKRQLSIFSFNIHVLSNNSVYFYCYDQTVARKGADDVCSMLYDFAMTKLSHEVTELELFCDSCAGQNKNWTLIRFLHYLVHTKKRFISVKISFPIRGHSYMECDRDMGLINQKAHTETPEDWYKLFESARVKPSPYNVIRVTQQLFFNFTSELSHHYRKSAPMATRPIRELKFQRDHPRLVMYRTSWNGSLESAVVRTPKQSKVAAIEFHRVYTAPIPLSLEKYNDLQTLKRFCSPGVQPFYDLLPKEDKKRKKREKNEDRPSDDEESDYG